MYCVFLISKPHQTFLAIVIEVVSLTDQPSFASRTHSSSFLTHPDFATL
jgi:hypothetical protein